MMVNKYIETKQIVDAWQLGSEEAVPEWLVDRYPGFPFPDGTWFVTDGAGSCMPVSERGYQLANDQH